MANDSQLEYEDEQVDEQPAQRPGAAQRSGSELPVKEGAVFGAIAVIATYLSHLFLTAIVTAQSTPIYDTVGDGETIVATDMVASWKAAGWSYLSVFGAGFELEGEPVTLGAAPNHAASFVTGAFSLSTLFLFLVTAGSIVAAGYAVARYTDADDAVDAAKAGVTVALPYLVFSVVIAFAMSHTYSELAVVEQFDSSARIALQNVELTEEAFSDVEFAPSTTDAILFAGLIVPAVLGVVGGLLTQPRDAIETVMAKVQ